MVVRIPAMLPYVVMGDSPQLLAQISTVLARRHSYLPLFDGPRLTRRDADAEVVRRNNAAARVRPRQIIFADLPDTTCALFSRHFPSRATRRITSADELSVAGSRAHLNPGTPLRWGTRYIGLGLLRALRSRERIAFDDLADAPRDPVPSRSGHLVVCEDGDEMAQVIAANYAFALDAGLCLIPAVPEQESNDLLERFYTVHHNRDHAPTSLLERLKRELRERMGDLPIVARGSVTFICKEIPWGFALPEVPSTHLFSYPDLGISIINGIAAEQPNSPGIRVAAIIDPGSVDSQEVASAVARLTPCGVFSVGIRSRNATAHRAALIIEEFPYDLLLISTHCGDASGWRWTYEFTDSEGIKRTLVTDTAIGVQVVPGQDDLHVTQFYRFVSLDGVDWTDPDKKAKLYVGRAILDWTERSQSGQRMEPVTKEEIGRVAGSMALRMADHNYIALPQALAAGGSPIVVNNACSSWHRLAGTFTFGNARAYIGTLFDVLDPEVQAIVDRLFGPYWNKPLAVALWRAQNDVSSDGVRRPYVMVGCHFQRLRATPGNALREVQQRILAVAQWERRRRTGEDRSLHARRRVDLSVAFLKEQLDIIDRYPSHE